jgi:tetratricopeptide (TPR) repeat protein
MVTKHRSSRSSVPAKKQAARSVKPAKVSKSAAKPATKATAKATRSSVASAKSSASANAGKRVGKPSDRPGAGTKSGRAVAAPRVVLSKPVPQAPAGPSAHDLAVESFERGFRSLQERRYREAANVLASMIDGYPDEKELHERARVYIAICERQVATERAKAPHTLEERMNAATVALNRGNYEEALGHLRSVEREDAENDLVHYMMAVAFTGLGDAHAALPRLQQAMELNSENRYLAAQDADLHPLRELPEFATLLEAPSARRRATTRDRSGR